MVSLSPKFILKSAGEWWLQPAMLMTLIYRFDSAGVQKPQAERAMANGQCFLSRRSALEQLDGYRCAATSFCDDVTLVREAARQGLMVGFLDGAKVISVRMYEGIIDTSRGWGRSLDLKDSISRAQMGSDLWLLISTQAIPIPLLMVAGVSIGLCGWERVCSPMLAGAITINIFLFAVRLGMQVAVTSSYDWSQCARLRSLFFWLSPLADPLAV